MQKDLLIEVLSELGLPERVIQDLTRKGGKQYVPKATNK